MIQRSEQEHHDHGHARLCCSSEYAVSNGFLSELPLQVAPDGEEQVCFGTVCFVIKKIQRPADR